MKKELKKQKGFYLVEAITALFLISTGLLVTVDLMSKVSTNTTRDRDNIIATMLAQEGVELVRNIRDNNYALGDTAFENNFPGASSDNCRITNMYAANMSISCDSSYKVYQNSSTKFYNQDSSGAETKFQRRISIRYIGEYARITSITTWKGDASSISIDNVSSDCTAENSCSYNQVNLTKWIQ